MVIYESPFPSSIISSRYGRRSSPGGIGSTFHRGTDYAAAPGSPVYPIAPGRITAAGKTAAEGNYCWVDHGGGIRSLYCHMQDGPRPRSGEITRWSVLGRVGSTGNSTGPHLHLGIQRNGQWIDPETILTMGDDDMSAAAEKMIAELYQELLPGKAGVKTQGRVNAVMTDTYKRAGAAHDTAEQVRAELERLLPGEAGVRHQGDVNAVITGAYTASREAVARIAGLEEAVKALAIGQGADPDAIMQAAERGVAAALERITVTVETPES